MRTLKVFGQVRKWKKNAIAASFIFPFLIVSHVFAIDILELNEGSHEEFTILTTIKFTLVWLLISVPATYYGAYRGMIKQDGDAEELANRRNSIPRLVPLGQPKYMNILFLSIVSGATIWASFCVAIRYMWLSVWRAELYAMFGYMLIFSILLIIIISELSIIWTFLGLKHGDYRW